MRIPFVMFCVLVFASTVSAQTAADETITPADRSPDSKSNDSQADPKANAELNGHWRRAIGLQSKRESETKFATGFLIQRDRTVFLVTAKHAARETNSETKLLYVNKQGASRWYLFRGLFAAGQDPWREHAHADLAVAKLAPPENTDPTLQSMRDVALDFSQLATALPPRTTPLQVVGFPLALGVGPKMSSLVIPGHLVSKELTKKGDWGTTPIAYSVPAIAAGASGAPAFDLSGQTPAVIGIYVAITRDKTGAKFSELVPSRLVREIIAKW
ncbi:MAG: serine protease [Planctomycetota bacterium]